MRRLIPGRLRYPVDRRCHSGIPPVASWLWDRPDSASCSPTDGWALRHRREHRTEQHARHFVRHRQCVRHPHPREVLQTCRRAIPAGSTDGNPRARTNRMAAGLTTVAGLLSFIAMDIEPMKDRRLHVGGDLRPCFCRSPSFRPYHADQPQEPTPRAERVSECAHRTRLLRKTPAHRRAIGAALLAALGATFAGGVEARMENRAFFSENSPPAQADRFLQRQFGGSLFIQVAVTGENDPLVLRCSNLGGPYRRRKTRQCSGSYRPGPRRRTLSPADASQPNGGN